MTRIRMGWFAAGAVVAMLGAFPSTGFAAFQPTAEQRSACIGDAFKFCSSDVPNVDRVVSCLGRQKSKISPRCRAVFDKAGG